MDELPEKRLDQNSWRLIPSKYPTIRLFEDLLDPSELEAAYALESLTNDRLRDEVGEIALVAPADRVTGPGTSPIMAAFTHVGVPSRFSDGQYGVYYAGLDLETALAESRHSRTRFFSATQEPAQTFTMRCYRARVSATLKDVRGVPEVHAADDYSASQALARRLRQAQDMGILYRSVRRPGGECVALFRPRALVPPAIECGHFEYYWNGREIERISKIVWPG